MPRNIKYLVVHCSDSPRGRGDTAETLHKWHKKRGWDGIGYNAVILEDGTLEHGRPDYWVPSQAKDYNSVSLGVCLIGRGNDATDEQMSALFMYLTSMLLKYPDAQVVGHNDLNPSKACPRINIKAWWESTHRV